MNFGTANGPHAGAPVARRRATLAGGTRGGARALALGARKGSLSLAKARCRSQGRRRDSASEPSGGRPAWAPQAAAQGHPRAALTLQTSVARIRLALEPDDSNRAQPSMHILGSHTINNGGIEMTVYRARAAGLDAVQVFTAIPKFYGDKSGISEERVERFRAALGETGIEGRNVVVHAAYVLNTANQDPEKRARAHGGLAKELERSTAIGAGGVCFHPGSAGKGDVAAALGYVTEAIVGALESVETDTRVWVENTAGAGATVGRTAEEVATILGAVPSSLRERTGYGLDTCHLYSAGYDIAHSREVFTAVLDEWEEAIGEPPSFFHLNDSQFPLGSNRDRHALIGEGEIGADAFRWLLADPRSQDIPLILETPQENYDIPDDDRSGDPYDVRMRELLEDLGAGG